MKILINMTKSFNFFGQYHRDGLLDVLEKVCKKLQFEQAKKGEVLFSQGNNSDKFYMILEGSAQEYYCNEKMINLEKIESNQNEIYLKSKIGSGNTFGSQGIIINKQRATTYICVQNAILAVLPRHSFIGLLKKQEERNLLKKIEIFKSLSLISYLSIFQIRDIALDSEQKFLQKGEFIFREGDKSDFIAIIIQGSFCVTKSFEVFNEIKNPLSVFNINEEGRKSKQKTFKIFDLGRMDFEGVETALNNEQRQYSIQCESLSGGEVIVLQSLLFKKLLDQFDPLQKQILDRVNEKEQLIRNGINRVGSTILGINQNLEKNEPEGKLQNQRHQKMNRGSIFSFNSLTSSKWKIQQLPKETKLFKVQNSPLNEEKEVTLYLEERSRKKSLLQNEKGYAISFFEDEDDPQIKIIEKLKQKSGKANYIESQRYDKTENEKKCSILNKLGYFHLYEEPKKQDSFQTLNKSMLERKRRLTTDNIGRYKNITSPKNSLKDKDYLLIKDQSSETYQTKNLTTPQKKEYQTYRKCKTIENESYTQNENMNTTRKMTYANYNRRDDTSSPTMKQIKLNNNLIEIKETINKPFPQIISRNERYSTRYSPLPQHYKFNSFYQTKRSFIGQRQNAFISKKKISISCDFNKQTTIADSSLLQFQTKSNDPLFKD